MNILVLDIGGTNVKVWKSAEAEPAKIKTGKKFTPDELVRGVKKLLGPWRAERISIGYPSEVRWGRPATEPENLGEGWVGFDFANAFDCPVRLMNDADMQALGCYEGGRMLYLGLGTGVGTTLIADGAITNLALGRLPFRAGHPFEHWLTKEALERAGLEAWREAVWEAAPMLKEAVIADYVMLGGSGPEKMDDLPEGCRRGGNEYAYFGGLRMWEDVGMAAAMLGRAR